MTRLLQSFGIGQLRWARGGQPVWHLTWDGTTSLCGYRLPGLKRFRALKAGPPKPGCDECKMTAKQQLGL